MVDGPNVKKPGKNLWTMDPVDAVYDLNKIIMPLAQKAKIVRAVRGSNYHVSPDRSMINYDEMFAQMIGAQPFMSNLLVEKAWTMNATSIIGNKVKSQMLSKRDNPLKKKLESEDNIFKRDLASRDTSELPYPKSGVKFKGIFNGVGIVLKHQVSFSSNYMYRGTGLTRNDLIMTLQKERHFPDGYNKIIHVYGHVHYFHITGNDKHYNFTIPCFKGKDDYLEEKDVSEPDYGIVEVIIEPNGDVAIHPFLLHGPDYPVEKPHELY